MLIINNSRVCPICGAYLDGKGVCANGHNVKHPVSIESLEKVRLEACNPDHINIVRQYEISKGYDRDANTQDKILKTYKVSYKVTSIDIDYDDIIVEAYDEDEAREKAIEKLEDINVQIEILKISNWR